MGKRGRELVGMDVEQLLDLLNRAFADEWLAYYQYWLGEKVVAGPLSGILVTELMEHAAQTIFGG